MHARTLIDALLPAPRARVLSEALDAATGRYLEENRSPSRKVGEPDNRTSHYWLARYWAEAMAAQSADAELSTRFGRVAEALAAEGDAIVAELNAVQGPAMDIGGYFQPDPDKAAEAMRPCSALNGIIDGIRSATSPI